MKSVFHLFPSLLLLLTISCNSKSVLNINDYGAVADSTTINTKAIQSAINDCSNSGGGTVLIPKGTYVSGTILLKDNVNLHLEKGALLQSSINPNDFYSIDAFIDATGQYRGQCFIGAIDAKNVAITGNGTIDGMGKMFLAGQIKKTLKALGQDLKKEKFDHLISKNNQYVNKNIRYSNRPFLIRMVRTSNFKIEGVQLKQPAAWTVHFFQCNDFLVDGVSIYSHANQNNDGIDIDSSTNGIIRNCDIDSGDDAICIKATSSKPTQYLNVYNCKLSSHWGAIKFGTESMGDFKDITIKNCHIHNNTGGGIKLLSVDGSNIENILIDSIKMVDVDMPIFVRLGERGLAYRNAKLRPVGSMKNIVISNIEAQTFDLNNSRVTPPSGILITGTPNHKIEGLKLENIKITLPGGGTKEHIELSVPEDEKRYPEFVHFGILPSYGLYARHIKNLDAKNITFKVTGEEQREALKLVDIDNKTLTNIK